MLSIVGYSTFTTLILTFVTIEFNIKGNCQLVELRQPKNLSEYKLTFVPKHQKAIFVQFWLIPIFFNWNDHRVKITKNCNSPFSIFQDRIMKTTNHLEFQQKLTKISTILKSQIIQAIMKRIFCCKKSRISPKLLKLKKSRIKLSLSNNWRQVKRLLCFVSVRNV